MVNDQKGFKLIEKPDENVYSLWFYSTTIDTNKINQLMKELAPTKLKTHTVKINEKIML